MSQHSEVSLVCDNCEGFAVDLLVMVYQLASATKHSVLPAEWSKWENDTFQRYDKLAIEETRVTSTAKPRSTTQPPLCSVDASCIRDDLGGCLRRSAFRAVLMAALNASNVKVVSMNWTTAKCINPVRDQMQCVSCWAFSAVGAAEPAHAS
ncbi:hypothetical protein H310_12951 [Aphanomyces invadans]|uniref:Peptidase C1A papain C-terminal domain-containing protein n=1 Tax=Aphanomyces invadans TaxID=157072 RepID=A0A024TG43_9STRA|nr:hypothetical protein H310_12951 [Aphanomyces invadans]ETV92954.1 hypothetical protein H310_12951 [Aphanomyces invadans]|eukprot:XP_008878475.1 hypothetical protein H310_12951 [Aphanomyces invadans]